MKSSKNCTCSCVYCQVGRTTGIAVTGKSFHQPVPGKTIGLREPLKG